MEIRPLRYPDELPLWAAMHTAVNPDRALSADGLLDAFSSKQDTAYFIALDGGEAVGYSWVRRRGSQPLPEARVLVLPGHRNRGIGSALFSEISRVTGANGYRELDAMVREVHPEGLAFAAHHGFVETGRNFELELDLTAIEAPDVELPDGIEIVTWAERPDLTRGLYEIDLEAIPDIPGEDDFEPMPLEQWLEEEMSGYGVRRDAIFIALAPDGEPVGYAMLYIFDNRPKSGQHNLTGVKRAWRGRGIAGALKATQIRWAKEAGFERLVTGNEERNTPILRLNARFGYRPMPGDVIMRGPIAS